MAPEAPVTPSTSGITPAEVAPPPRGLIARIKVLAFIVVVIAVECLVAYLYMPSAAETAAMAGAAATTDPAEAAKTGEASEDQPPGVQQAEVDLGEFSVTAYQPVSNTTLRIDFHLYGTVAAEDESEFLKRMQDNLHRFREQVIVTVRSAELTDLTDAGLGLLKRRIQEKANQTLGKPLLRAVVFSDFSFIEQ